MLYEKLLGMSASSDRIILTDTKEELTYSNLDSRVRKTAEQMRSLGIEAGMRVVIRNENTIRTVTEILACIYLHVCFLLLPEKATGEQIDYVIADSRAALLIDHNSSDFRMLELQKSCSALSEEDELIYILYTSGSTGRPKGVMASCRQVMFCIEAINERLRNGENDRILCVLPLAFDYGLYQLFLALQFGAKLILFPHALMQQIPALLKQERITAFPAMPAMLNMILTTGLLQRVKLPGLRYISSTGDNLPVELIRRLHDLFPHVSIFPMYGLTECKRVSIMPENRWDKIWKGSCGIPLTGTEVYLDQKEEDGIGELIVKGPNVMEGYWNSNGEEGTFFIDEKGNKCLRTGDCFRIDQEGFLYFCSRKKRILKTYGYRIGCGELESRLSDQIGELADELRIIGIPCETMGDKIIVCIHSQIDTGDLLAKVKEAVEKLPPYQRPHSLYHTTSVFPLNNNGKIDDDRLRKDMKTNGLYDI